MKDLRKFEIEIDRRQEYKGSETLYSDLRIWLRMDADEDAPVLCWIRFLLLGDDGLDLFAGRSGALSDGYHQLIPFSELWTFYDTDRLFNGDVAGEGLIPYRRVTVPAPVQKFILDDIEAGIARYDAQGDKREKITLDYSERLAAWSDEYGQGKGSITIEGHLSAVAAIGQLGGEATFDRSWNSIERLALAETHSTSDCAPIKIFRESPTAFLWTAGRMHGGLINHGSEDAPEWSVHT
jgi:hypothetical protein